MLEIYVTLWTLFLICLSGFFFGWAPSWSRPELFFAITVPADFRTQPAAREILQRYRRHVVAATAVAFLLTLALATAGVSIELGFIPAFLGQMVWCQGAFVTARRATSRFAVTPTGVRQAVLTPHRDPLPGGWGLWLLPFAILGLTALGLGLFWDRIPETIITHWNGSGEADAWAAKSWRSVFAPLLMLGTTCVLVALLSLGMLRWAKRVHVEGEAARLETARRKTIISLLLGVQVFMALIGAFIALQVLFPPNFPAVPLGILLLFLCGILGAVVFVRTRVLPLTEVTARASEAVAAGRPRGDGTPDACWKLGIFYYNPDDPAIFIEKRVGFGYDMNFARPLAWIILLTFIFAPLVVILSLVE